MKFINLLAIVGAAVQPFMASANHFEAFQPSNDGINSTIVMDLWAPDAFPTGLTWPFNVSDIVLPIVNAKNFSNVFVPAHADNDCDQCRMTCLAISWIPPAFLICMIVCQANVCHGI